MIVCPLCVCNHVGGSLLHLGGRGVWHASEVKGVSYRKTTGTSLEMGKNEWSLGEVKKASVEDNKLMLTVWFQTQQPLLELSEAK